MKSTISSSSSSSSDSNFLESHNHHLQQQQQQQQSGYNTASTSCSSNSSSNTNSHSTYQHHNSPTNSLSSMPKLNRLTIAPTAPADLSPPDHPGTADPVKRRRIDQFPDLAQSVNNSDNTTHYARPPFSMPARLSQNNAHRQQLFAPPFPQQPAAYYCHQQQQQPPQHNHHPLMRSQSLASLRSAGNVINDSQSMQRQQTYAAPPVITPSLSMHTVADLYHRQQQQQPRQSLPPLRPAHHPPPASAQALPPAETSSLQQQQQQLPFSSSAAQVPVAAKAVGDDDLIVDEEMTNKNVCVGMIKTDIVTVKVLGLIKDEQYEAIRLESEGRRDSVNYSFTVTSCGMPRKFYGWVPFEDTKILGPLVEHRLIWWDAVIPRGKANHARTPLYIIIYCRPLHVDIVAKTFERHHATLKEPPFFNPACRYKNPHAHLIQQQQEANSQRLWSVGRPGRPSSTDQNAIEQTRRDIAQLLDSIPNGEDDGKANDNDASRKRKKKRWEALQRSGTRDNQIVLSDEDEHAGGDDKDGSGNSNSNDMDEDSDEMQVDNAQIEGLTVRLMPHQSRGVEWMIGREANETSCGGILADMGLGKTIQTIGLVASTMDAAAKRPTLIVTPLALIQQWATEIRTKTEKGKMSVLVHHGASRSKDPAIFSQYDVVVTTYQVVASDMPNTTKRGRRRNNNNGIEEDLMDVQTPNTSEDCMSPVNSAPGSPATRSKLPQENGCCLSSSPSSNDGSASTLKPGYGPLFQIEWYRVVLDEAQQIKNRNTRSALSCSELAAQKRWCLTGTPMQNHVDELYSLLRFLRIQPLCDYQAFKKTISVPIQAGQGQLALERLKVVLMAVMLRRTKQILKSATDSTAATEAQPSSPSTAAQKTSSCSNSSSSSAAAAIMEGAERKEGNSSGSSSSSSIPTSPTTTSPNNTQNESSVADPKEGASSKNGNLSTELSLQLPSRNKRDIVLTFSAAERTLYDFLNTKTKSTVEKLFRAGKGERNYLNMLCMLLRLRQACDHPRLVLKAMGNDAEALELATGGVSNGSSSSSTSNGSGSNGAGNIGRKEAREASEVAAQRTIMAKMAADLGWQGVGQVGQSVFDKNTSSVSGALGTTCELCGKTITTTSTSSSSSSSSSSTSISGRSSYCPTCTNQIEQCTAQEDSLMTSSKINKVLELLNETRLKYPREKTIIFSQFTSMLDLLEEQLQRSGFKYCRYDGSMSNHLRERNLEALRTDTECTVMLISLKCGSLGLNLTAANHVILMDVWWNPAVEEQAIDRVHRIGQRLPVRVVRLVIDGTIEQKIIQLQQKKAQMVQGALGDGMIKNSKLTMREIRTLFDL